eukprot:774217-Pelagomonas_calceolata.AAC.6
MKLRSIKRSSAWGDPPWSIRSSISRMRSARKMDRANSASWPEVPPIHHDSKYHPCGENLLGASEVQHLRD